MLFNAINARNTRKLHQRNRNGGSVTFRNQSEDCRHCLELQRP